jgi:hypothetical protein
LPYIGLERVIKKLDISSLSQSERFMSKKFKVTFCALNIENMLEAILYKVIVYSLKFHTVSIFF